MKKTVILVFSLLLIMLTSQSSALAGGEEFSSIHMVSSENSLSGLVNKDGFSLEEKSVKIDDSTDLTYKGSTIQVTSSINKPGQHLLMTKEEFKDWLLANHFNRKINTIQQHHTWAPSYKRFNGSNHLNLLKGMENYHVSKMGWKTIAQNITTFPDGKVAVSRPFDMEPEGTIGPKANKYGIAIEHIGNFDVGNDVMTKEQKDTIVYINALLCLKFGLTPTVDSITYHHWWNLKTGDRVLDKGPDYNVKTCPGTGFFGGNSTESAKKYFYPLISHEMQELSANMN